MTKTKVIDRKSRIGKAVSLIDTISILCSQLGQMGEKTLTNKSVVQAIRDLQGDELASHVIGRLHKTRQREATEKFFHEAVSKLTPAERKRIGQLLKK